MLHSAKAPSGSDVGLAPDIEAAASVEVTKMNAQQIAPLQPEPVSDERYGEGCWCWMIKRRRLMMDRAGKEIAEQDRDENGLWKGPAPID